MLSLHLAREKIRHPDKIGDKTRARRLIYLIGRTNLLDTAVPHDGNTIRQRQGFLLVMSDKNRSDTKLLLEETDLDLHTLTQLFIQSTKRFVEQ